MITKSAVIFSTIFSAIGCAHASDIDPLSNQRYEVSYRMKTTTTYPKEDILSQEGDTFYISNPNVLADGNPTTITVHKGRIVNDLYLQNEDDFFVTRVTVNPPYKYIEVYEGDFNIKPLSMTKTDDKNTTTVDFITSADGSQVRAYLTDLPGRTTMLDYFLPRRYLIHKKQADNVIREGYIKDGTTYVENATSPRLTIRYNDSGDLVENKYTSNGGAVSITGFDQFVEFSGIRVPGYTVSEKVSPAGIMTQKWENINIRYSMKTAAEIDAVEKRFEEQFKSAKNSRSWLDQRNLIYSTESQK